MIPILYTMLMQSPFRLQRRLVTSRRTHHHVLSLLLFAIQICRLSSIFSILDMIVGVNGFVVPVVPISMKDCVVRKLRRRRRCRQLPKLSTLSSTPSSQQEKDQILKDCICLVTGGSRGIGKGIAIQLGIHGATVFVTGTSSSTKTKNVTSTRQLLYETTPQTGGPGTIEETAQLVTDAGGVGIPVYCNHVDDQHVEELLNAINDKYGRLDILVNNAFRIPPGAPKSLFKPFWEQGPEVWDTVHTIGLRNHFVTTCYAMPLLQKAQLEPHRNISRPLIVMISSFGGLSYTFNTPYGVAKAALDRMAKDMAIELADTMCVVSLWPGVVATERTIQTQESGDWDQYVQIPLIDGLIESPQYTGKAVVAIATDPNNYEKSGQRHVVAELANIYDFDDITGKRIPSIRSLKFLLPTYGMTEQQRQSIPIETIPDVKLPFWIMAMGRPPRKEK